MNGRNFGEWFWGIGLCLAVLVCAIDTGRTIMIANALLKGPEWNLRAVPPVPAPEPLKTGQIVCEIRKTPAGEGKDAVLVSSGIPFARGQLRDAGQVRFFSDDGQELPAARRVLARWPQDQSVRSVLVQFPDRFQGPVRKVSMRWGESARETDGGAIKPVPDLPEAVIVPPAGWLCDSQVIGEQAAFGQTDFPGYDRNILKMFPGIAAYQWTGQLRKDGYYSTPHVFYQFYVRTGELKYFLAARKELVYYREKNIIHTGSKAGQSTVDGRPRYLYLEALRDDYFLTGDPRTLEVAGEMVRFLEHEYPPEKAFLSPFAWGFWTERLHGSVLSGYLAYYEMTGERKYFDLAQRYFENVYRMQLVWPGRGGFIHNLYAHDPTEGAGVDEYGGSPFMTGLILEAVIEYHRITGSPLAADSVLRALDWLLDEGLNREGDAFRYTTARRYRDSGGEPDLNLLIVHALGYGYKISGEAGRKYLEAGRKIFERGVRDGYLGDRKHFNQQYRSSGHFLAYIRGEEKR